MSFNRASERASESVCVCVCVCVGSCVGAGVGAAAFIRAAHVPAGPKLPKHEQGNTRQPGSKQHS